MTQEKAKELLPIIQAIAEGKDFTLQTPNGNGGWVDCNGVLVPELLYYTYRIKPEENFVYKHGDKFVIMDVRFPLIKDPPLFEGSLEECNKWIDEQVKEPTCTRDDVLMAEEVEGNYTIEQNCGENRVEGGVLGVSGSVSEKKYRPFKDCNELVECWEKKLFTPAVMFTEDTRNKLYRPSIWVKSKEYGTDFLITAFDNNNESIGANVIINDMGVTMKMLFDNYIFCDNSVCGVEE